jgi:hypothetical protein
VRVKSFFVQGCHGWLKTSLMGVDL